MANDLSGFVFEAMADNVARRALWAAMFKPKPTLNLDQVLNLDRSRKIKDLVSKKGMGMFGWSWCHCVCGTVAQAETMEIPIETSHPGVFRSEWYRQANLMWGGLETLMGVHFGYLPVEEFMLILDRHIAKLEEQTVEDDHRGDQAAEEGDVEDEVGVVEPAHGDHPPVAVRAPHDSGVVGPGRRAGPVGQEVGRDGGASGEGVPGELVEVG